MSTNPATNLSATERYSEQLDMPDRLKTPANPHVDLNPEFAGSIPPYRVDPR